MGRFQKDVKAKEKMDKITNLGDAESKFKCPVCGSPMIVKPRKERQILIMLAIS